jgi:hypothetical protein
MKSESGEMLFGEGVSAEQKEKSPPFAKVAPFLRQGKAGCGTRKGESKDANRNAKSRLLTIVRQKRATGFGMTRITWATSEQPSR